MKNYKNIRWIEELQNQLDEKFGGLNLISVKEDNITDHPRHEISETPVLKKEKS
ncbi:hypothetical protein [Chryseobacterium viscerum]|uniref:hypothetical protein n=1 Tax=Chryseobacterium viscerum TaxID=1037377 RepID=UPI00129B4B47|nr:hypothetical protein [Chryseobacterium viscerum]